MQQTNKGQLTVVAWNAIYEATTVSWPLLVHCRLSEKLDHFCSMYWGWYSQPTSSPVYIVGTPKFKVCVSFQSAPFYPAHRGISPGQIKGLVCAPKLICAIVCATKLVCAVICAHICAPKLVCLYVLPTLYVHSNSNFRLFVQQLDTRQGRPHW